MSVRTRLVMACLLLLILDASLGLFARDQQLRMGERAVSIYDGAYIGLNYIAEVQTGLVRLTSAYANPSTRPPNDAVASALRKLMGRLEVVIERAMSVKARIDGQALLAKFEILTHETSPALLAAGLAQIDRDLTVLVHRYGADGLATRDEVDQSVEDGDHLVLLVSAGVVLVSLGIVVILARSILPPLRNAVGVANAIAGGKLDTEIKIDGPAEIAQLMRALDRMQSAIATNQADLEARRAVDEALRMQALQNETDEARQLQHAAEEASRAKSTFLAMMSHEIRTPMNAVLGLTMTLLDDDLQAEQHQVVKAIHSSSGNLMRILNDVLDFSRLDAGRMTFELMSFSPATLTQETLSVHGPAAVEKGLRLDVTQTPDVPPLLIADAGRIGQVLHNLVSNAIKFTKSGTVTVRAACLGHEGDNARMEWTVSDTGIGITAEQLAGLFDPFVQADTSIARRFGGSGLGLAICKQLVDRMGGTISASSTPQTGSTFRVQLPLKLAQEGTVAADVETLAKRLAQLAELRPLRMLLAEDNRTNQFVFTRMLKDAKIRIDIANNGVEAVRWAETTAYDMICMDMSMPEMDGLEATRAIRRGGACEKVPIVAMTANAFPEDVEACRDAGMNDFVTKPIKKPILIDAILNALRPGNFASGWWGPDPVHMSSEDSDPVQHRL